MKKVFRKSLICIIIAIITFNFLFEPSANATATTTAGGVAESAILEICEVLASVGDGLMGILTYLPKLQALTGALAILGIMTLVATTFGYVDSTGNPVVGADIGLLTPDDIFFNKLTLTDINIFNMNTSLDSTILTIRTNIALWYYIMRTIAVSVLLAILIYIAIRMAISTVASDKAQYKKMLVNWASSIALVFVLHYLIVFVCYLNSAFVKIFANIYDSLNTSTTSGIMGVLSSDKLDLGIGNLLNNALSISATTGWASVVVVGMLIAITFAFLLYYVKRMLTVAFLIIISPLITITYSIDKLGDGKAQALNAWLKEFFFTVIIQPFHCVIYMVFMSLALSALGATSNGLGQVWNAIFNVGIDSLVGGLLAILCMKFVWDAEKMVKNIFGIKVSEGLGDAVAMAGIAGALVQKSTSAATKATGAVAKKVTNVGKTGTMGGVFKDATNKLGQTKLGQSIIEKKKRKEFEKDRDYIRQQRAAGSNKSVRELRDERRKKAEDAKLKNRIKNNKTIKGFTDKVKGKKDQFSDYLNNDPNGQRLKRYLVQDSPAIAAAMLGGGIIYGSDKRSLFDAGVTGYGIYKGVGSGIEKLRRRKSESYTENVTDDASIAAEASDDGSYNKDNNADNERYAETAQRMGEEGDFSEKKIQEKYDKSEENLTEILKQDDTLSDEEISNRVNKILQLALNGVFNRNMDYTEIAKGSGLTPEQVKSAISGLVYTKAMSNIYQENQNINALSGDDKFYRSVWAGIHNNSLTPNYTEYTGNTNIDWNNVQDDEQAEKLADVVDDYQKQADTSSKETDVLLEQLLAYLKTLGTDLKDKDDLQTKIDDLMNGPDDHSQPIAEANLPFSDPSISPIDLNEDDVAMVINDTYNENPTLDRPQLMEKIVDNVLIQNNVHKEDINKVTQTEREEIRKYIVEVAGHQSLAAAKEKIDRLQQLQNNP